MKRKQKADDTAQRQVRKLVGPEASSWDETIVVYAASEHVPLPELLDMVMDATRTVHGVAYHPRQNEQVVRYVLEQLDQINIYRSRRKSL